MRGTAAGLLLVAIHLAGCGGKTGVDLGTTHLGDASVPDAATIAFPIGTYSHCAQGIKSDGVTLNTVGFIEGAVLALTESASGLSATYVDQGGASHAFDFTPTTNTSASLASTAQISGFTGLCVLGVGISNEQPYPAALNASAGAMTYDAGTIFVSLHGQLGGAGGQCGPHYSLASLWIACDGGPSQAVETKSPLPTPQLPVGDYACSSQIATFYESNGLKQYVASGGDGGALTLMQTGAVVTAAYSGDSFVTGTLHFDITTATTAIVDAGQSLTTPCEVPIANGAPPPQTPATLPIASASLTLFDSTLLVSVAGKMDASSSCSGAQKAGSLICSKK